MSTAAVPHPEQPRLAGLLVEFDSPGALITAAERVRDAGYTRWDTHSPFPVHGIDEAMGIRPTRLPWIIMLLGVAGMFGGLLLQWWTNAAGASSFPWVPTFLQGYNFVVSGKPAFSLPANIPVIFEVTVLFAALAAVIGMFALNNLPRHFNPLLASGRARRVTADRFYLYVEAADPKFHAQKTTALLENLGAGEVAPIAESAGDSRFPRGMRVAVVIIATLAVLPPLLIAKARVSLSTTPRIQIVQDMDNQERYKTQQSSPVFADGRSSRPDVPGTVARGDVHPDPFFYEGKVDGQDATGFPPRVVVNVPLMQRGQQRFNIYCAPCHGLDGAGNGIVHQRALKLNTAGWVQPLSIHDPTVRDRANGHLFNTISYGIRTMPPYGDQIPPADRWAIVAYVRALQYGQHAKLEDVPADVRNDLK